MSSGAYDKLVADLMQSEFERGVVAERERVTRIIREHPLTSERGGVGFWMLAPDYRDALLVALGVEDNQPGTTP